MTIDGVGACDTTVHADNQIEWLLINSVKNAA